MSSAEDILKKRTAFIDNVIFLYHVKIIKIGKTLNMEDTDMARIVDLLIRGHELVLRKNIEPENQGSLRCIENLLNASEMNSISFLYILSTEHEYLFGLDAIIFMLTDWAKTNEVNFFDVVLGDAFEGELIDPSTQGFIDYLVLQNNARLTRSILLHHLDSFSVIGEFLSTLFQRNKKSEDTNVSFILKTFSSSNITEINGSICDMIEELQFEKDVKDQLTVSLIQQCDLTKSGKPRNEYESENTTVNRRKQKEEDKSTYEDSDELQSGSEDLSYTESTCDDGEDEDDEDEKNTVMRKRPKTNKKHATKSSDDGEDEDDEDEDDEDEKNTLTLTKKKVKKKK